MKAMILAAGRGERLRPLTDTVPKPLLTAGDKPLIAWHLEKLAAVGIRDVIINTSWLAEEFTRALGDGMRWGLRLHYLYEGTTPLETGGGIHNALPLLAETTDANAPFIVVNGDIWSDYDYGRLPLDPEAEAHLVMVANPAHNPAGDFSLSASHAVASQGSNMLTYTGIGVYRPSLFDDWRGVIGDTEGVRAIPPHFKLAPLLRMAMSSARISGERHDGHWTDAGTAQRLAQLDALLRADPFTSAV